MHNALRASEKLKKEGIDVGIIDIYRLKPLDVEPLAEALKPYNKVVSLEEHLLAGGLGSMMAEIKADKRLDWDLERIGINDRLVYFYGRENIQRELGIDVDAVVNRVKKLFN